MKNRSILFHALILVVLFAGCYRPDISATPPPGSVPLHCLDYTDVEDSVYPDTVYVLANCVEGLAAGATVGVAPISPFDEGITEKLAGLHYVADLSGNLLKLANSEAGETPMVGYEYAHLDEPQINRDQLVSIERNLHLILSNREPAGLGSLKEVESLPPATLPAKLDLEKLTNNLILAVQWYESIRPLLANIAANSNSDADNTLIQILDLTLKPLSLTVKEVNGIVNSAKSGATAEEKAAYTTEAALRIQQSTAALQTYIWTLVYEKIDGGQ